MKYLYNPETDSFESLEPTLRDRFVLGGRVNFDKGSPFPITDEVLKQIDDLIKNTNLNLKVIGKKINYGTEKRSLTIDTPVMEAYIEKYGKTVFEMQKEEPNFNHYLNATYLGRQLAKAFQ